MGFHTFECYHIITCNEYKKLKNTLSNKGKFYRDPKCINHFSYISECLDNHGIKIRLNQFNENGYSFYYASYIINPRRVIEENNYVGIFISTNVDDMLFACNKYIKSKSNKLPEIYDCKLSRIDYCYNIQLDNMDTVSRYIKLSKRCNVPYGFNMEKYFDKKAKKKVISQDGINLKRSNLVEISFYNKQRQMDKNKFKYPDGNNANGIVRFEIQCFKTKVKNLHKKYDIEDIAEFLNKSDKISYDIFNYYIPQMFGTGDFYTTEKAYEFINGSKYATKTKEEMISLVKNTAEYSNLNKAEDEFKEKHGKTKLNVIIKKFNKLDLSPLTIPRRWDIDYIPNPLSYIEDEY